ncbi:LpxL/LpxP family acyltransferase [Thioalkalivibrio paradoxus]|nr:hypothetical protein [Thioalkalivibrio paradoxus]
MAAQLPGVTQILRARLRPIATLTQLLGQSRMHPDSIQRRHLGLAVLGSWRYCALTCAPRQVWEHWVTVSALERITDPLKSGKRVIVLNSHYGLGHIANVALAREGIDTVSLLTQNRLDSTYGVSTTGSGEPLHFIELGRGAFQLQGLARAREALEQGRVLHLAGDGGRGGNPMTLPFLHGTRDLRGGFASLALLTGAEVIPVFSTLEPSGRVQIEFEPALARPDAKLEQREAIATMVRAYGKRLEARWRRDPSQVLADQIRQYLDTLE